MTHSIPILPEPARFAPNATDDDVRAAVRERYAAAATGESPCCGPSCGCGAPVDADALLERLGYSAADARASPADSNLGLGCGNPLAYAAVKPGETVLDLGSGAGIDCFLAARETGPSGTVIGVDMTPAMITKSRDNARKHGYANVEFRLGEIEHLPVADASVDVVISNCVVNLSPQKLQVFRDALRVLRPGGRIVLSDLVLTRALDPDLQRSIELYCGCVAGASQKRDYLHLLREAGFVDVTVAGEGSYDVGADALPADSPERRAFEAVVSVKVRATKPA
jgi:arsenite methyltransferase